MDNCWDRVNLFVVRVARGCMLPHLYGVYRYDPVSEWVYACPIPFNWLIKWGIKLYDKICFPNVVSGDYAKGYHDGWEAAKRHYNGF